MIEHSQPIQVRDRADWKVAPEALWREINHPGSTNLPKILPLIDEQRHSLLLTLAPNEIPAIELTDRLNNLHLRLFSIRKGLLRQIGLMSPPGSVDWTPGDPVPGNQKVGVRWFTDLRHEIEPERGPSYSRFQGFSLRYLQGTDVEFFGKIAEAIVAAGIKDQEIIELYQAHRNPEKFPKGHFRSLHAGICLPIYSELYNLGYGRREIAG